MSVHECVEAYKPNSVTERLGRLATVTTGIALTIYAVREKDIATGLIGLGIAIPSGVNAVVSEI